MHGLAEPMAAEGAARAPGTGASRWLVLEGIHHAYDAAPVVKGVDLVVGPGEIMCLLARRDAERPPCSGSPPALSAHTPAAF